VQLWKVATRRPIGKPIPGSASPGFNSVVFSPDGKTLATGMVESVAIWDVATGRQISRSRSFTGRRAGRRGQGGEHIPAYTVAFSPDGKTLATGSDNDKGDGTVRIWDVAAGRQSGGELLLTRSGPNSEAVVVVVFSPNGKTLATVSGDGTVRLWDVATHRPIGKPITSLVASVAFSPDGKTLATGSGDGTVRLWDVPPTARSAQPSPATPARSPRRRSARTARPWSPSAPTSAAMAPCGCGTWPPAARSAAPSPATPT
jgi:WD40 repeat protein